MKTSGNRRFATLLAAVIFSLAWIAPPAYSQSTKDQLNQLMSDVLNLTNAVKQMQGGADQKNSETIKLLEQVLARFSAVDSSIQKLSDSTATALKADSDKTARDLQETRAAVTAVKDGLPALVSTAVNSAVSSAVTSAVSSAVAPLNESITGLQNRVAALTRQINEMKTAEAPLPSPRAVFNDAWSALNQGQYEIAILGFRDFLKTYPADPMFSQSAQIYIGEAFSAQKKFNDALIEYDRALQNFPNGDKRCQALFKKGQTHVELKQNPQATTALQNVTKECPKTDEAALAEAALKKLAPAKRGDR